MAEGQRSSQLLDMLENKLHHRIVTYPVALRDPLEKLKPDAVMIKEGNCLLDWPTSSMELFGNIFYMRHDEWNKLNPLLLSCPRSLNK